MRMQYVIFLYGYLATCEDYRSHELAIHMKYFVVANICFYEFICIILLVRQLYNIYSVRCNAYLSRETNISWFMFSSQWRQNGRGSVSNHQPRDCLFNRYFRFAFRKMCFIFFFQKHLRMLLEPQRYDLNYMYNSGVNSCLCTDDRWIPLTKGQWCRKRFLFL